MPRPGIKIKIHFGYYLKSLTMIKVVYGVVRSAATKKDHNRVVSIQTERKHTKRGTDLDNEGYYRDQPRNGATEEPKLKETFDHWCKNLA